MIVLNVLQFYILIDTRVRDSKVTQNLGNFRCSVARYFTPAHAHAFPVRIHEQSQVEPLHKKEGLT